MRALMLIILLFAWATAACAQTIYYATFRGDNYAQKLWHTASLAAFKAAPPDDVYDSYTVEARRDGSISCGATTALPPAIGDSSSPTSTAEIGASTSCIQSLSLSAASPFLARTRDLLGAFAISQFLRVAHSRRRRSASSTRRLAEKSPGSFTIRR